ncbi:MAG: matrixin family metalloprotease [Pirellulales bacterium]
MVRYGNLVVLALVALGGAMRVDSARAFIITPTDPDPWLTTASGSRTGNGLPATITWSIVPDGTTTERSTTTSATAPSNLIAFMNTNFGGVAGQTNLTLQPWFHIYTDVFSRWSELSGANFVFESHDDGVRHPSSNGQLGVRGDIRLAGANVDGAGSVLAFTYLPASGSDMVIDTSEASFFGNNTQNFINLRNTILHEVGHAFGLEHVTSTTSNLLMEPIIDTSFDGPQLDEVRGIQYFFGDANEKSNGGLGNATAALATSLGTIPAGGAKAVGTSANVPTQTISPTAKDFVSISNAGDIDYYSFTVTSPSVLNATLTPRGGVFNQGSADDNQTPTTFNANARNNLSLTLYGSDGTTIIGFSNDPTAGVAENISGISLPAAGTYYARVLGLDDTVQLYELAVSATSVGLPGDYNHNGVVDAADYSLWRDSLGQSVVAGSGADGNADGQITSADFDVWRAHFGQTSGAGGGSGVLAAAVPEPATIGLAILGVLGACNGRRKRCGYG